MLFILLKINDLQKQVKTLILLKRKNWRSKIVHISPVLLLLREEK